MQMATRELLTDQLPQNHSMHPAACPVVPRPAGRRLALSRVDRCAEVPLTISINLPPKTRRASCPTRTRLRYSRDAGTYLLIPVQSGVAVWGMRELRHSPGAFGPWLAKKVGSRLGYWAEWRKVWL